MRLMVCGVSWATRARSAPEMPGYASSRLITRNCGTVNPAFSSAASWAERTARVA